MNLSVEYKKYCIVIVQWVISNYLLFFVLSKLMFFFVCVLNKVVVEPKIIDCLV